jgi:hypothetical protein
VTMESRLGAPAEAIWERILFRHRHRRLQRRFGSG